MLCILPFSTRRPLLLLPPTTEAEKHSAVPTHHTPADHVDDRVSEQQQHLNSLIAHLDAEVAKARKRLDEVMLRVDPSNPDPEALVERETEYHSLNERIDRLNIASLGLVFGRIDVFDTTKAGPEHPVPGHPDHDRRYIGRLGLHDRDNGYETLLLDWRAPTARPFYLATTAQPEGVIARRHIKTKGTTVTDVTDEYLADIPEAAGHAGGAVGDETPLLAALNRARSGHMSDIVETIQREQDEIIRDSTRSIMVVTGGPGTGKTAVALHRVAYLLYTWRAQLSKTGVLIIGPNTTFLDYISRVLPELGETGVVLSTVAGLYPGFSPQKSESLLVKEIKGSAEMATILDRAVKNHQLVPSEPVAITLEGLEVTVTPAMVKASRTRARRSRKPHNFARPIFRDHLTESIARAYAHHISADPLGGGDFLGEGDVAQIHDDICDEQQLTDLLDQLWPQLDPVEVLAELVGSTEVIDAAATGYDEETKNALYRDDPSAFSTSDTALIDELAHLIGIPDPDQADDNNRRAWRQQIADAEDALDILQSSANTDLDDESEAEILSAHDIIDPETLAQRQKVRDTRTTAQRAAADHTWAFGHVIVDEAQELSPMEWRMVMRRCPARWMTLVGDTAQTGHPAGVDSWTETLEPFAGTRCVRHELTVNYRTPQTITDFAEPLLEVIAPEQTPPTAIRDGNRPVTIVPADTDPLAVKQRLEKAEPERLTAIIAPPQSGIDGARTVDDIKGLEFDHVIVVDPAAIAEASVQGLNDLYVAYTRATQTLTVIGDPPHPTGPFTRGH